MHMYAYTPVSVVRVTYVIFPSELILDDTVRNNRRGVLPSALGLCALMAVNKIYIVIMCINDR